MGSSPTPGTAEQVLCFVGFIGSLWEMVRRAQNAHNAVRGGPRRRWLVAIVGSTWALIGAGIAGACLSYVSAAPDL